MEIDPKILSKQINVSGEKEMPAIKILIVGDEKKFIEVLNLDLKSMGYEICTLASTGIEAIETAEKERPDLALMDMRLSGDINCFLAGGELSSRFKIPSIYMTGGREDKLKGETITNLFGLLVKPVTGDELMMAINLVLKRQ